MNTLLLSVLGVMLYLMLFEARARYLLCFVPVLLVTAALGIETYGTWFMGLARKGISLWKKKRGK